MSWMRHILSQEEQEEFVWSFSAMCLSVWILWWDEEPGGLKRLTKHVETVKSAVLLLTKPLMDLVPSLPTMASQFRRHWFVWSPIGGLHCAVPLHWDRTWISHECKMSRCWKGKGIYSWACRLGICHVSGFSLECKMKHLNLFLAGIQSCMLKDFFVIILSGIYKNKQNHC